MEVKIAIFWTYILGIWLYFGCPNLYFGCLNLYFGCMNLYLWCLNLYFGCLNLYRLFWVSEFILWVSELILWVSELVSLVLGVWTYTFGHQRTKHFEDHWIWKHWRTKHSGMTCESGNTEGPSIFVWLANLVQARDLQKGGATWPLSEVVSILVFCRCYLSLVEVG